MPLIPFPNIPAFPGVPHLPRSPLIAKAEAVIALVKDELGLASISQDPKWGIYDDSGDPVAEADSVISFDHTKDWRISDYPVEPNGFSSFNKVETPFDQRVVFAKGGTEADRADFLDAINAAVSSLDLFSVVTPEITYTNANLVHLDYRRSSRNGVTLLLVEIGLREVRTTASAAFTNTQSPVGAATQSGGTVQPQTPTAAQSAAAAGGAT